MRGFLKSILPGKFSEIVGVQHTKVCVFDNDVCISGANLSNDYFTDRQDRYILIKDSPGLADYFEDLVDNISSFSFDLNQSNNKAAKQFSFTFNDPNNEAHPYQGNYDNFVRNVNKKFTAFLSKQKANNNLTFGNTKDKFVTLGSNSDTSFNNDQDTWVFPSVQMGIFGINQDELLTSKFLENSGKDKGAKIVFGTGYFNLTDDYMNSIINKSKASFDILCAHPKANSFFNAPFPLYGVPFAYTYIAKHFMSQCAQAGASNRIRMFEYQKPSWTFHGKGKLKRTLCMLLKAPSYYNPVALT